VDADEEKGRIGTIDAVEQEQPLSTLRAIDCSDRLAILDAIVPLRPGISGGEVGIWKIDVWRAFRTNYFGDRALGRFRQPAIASPRHVFDDIEH
jgi:hypothetical protein